MKKKYCVTLLTFISHQDVESRSCDSYRGELGYDGPLYNVFLHMTDNMLGPSLMHIKYLTYVYDGFCI